MPIIRATTESLKIDNLFLDGDTRTITLKNPKSSITQSEIIELDNFIEEKNALIGDKEGAAFGRIKTVTRITQETQYIGDLELT